MVFDSIGGDSYNKSLKLLDRSGMLVAFGSYHSPRFQLIKDYIRVKLFNIIPWYQSRIFIQLEHFISITLIGFEDLRLLVNMLLNNEIDPIIGEVFSLKDVRKAHYLLDKGAIKVR